MVKELKKELSKLSGVDFFNPKFRAVFKKYFPDEEDAKSGDEVADNVEAEVEEVAEPVVEDNDNVEEVKEEVSEEEETEEVEETDNVEDSEEVEEINEEEVVDKEPQEPVNEEPQSEPVMQEETPVAGVEDVMAELLDTKIELELIKSGVKPERLNSAKKMAKYEVTSLDELGKIQEMLGEYPEWVAGEKAENFGMPVDETSDNLTEEEKRLKEMGIDPKN